MNATQAKELLLTVPKEDFITHSYTDGEGKCCGIGHLERLSSNDPNDYSPDNCMDLKKYEEDPVSVFVRKQVYNFLTKNYAEELPVKVNSYLYIPNLAHVNNQDNINGFTQDNPKDRVIALLDEMIAAGY